eukprot:c19902_g2_i2.p1 GENE.c19902_g2_i2~~c19902_g2_i2.p1  ORF type:complete len:360 (+),score=76.98 c19902_g2_i2:42-1121(+)
MQQSNGLAVQTQHASTIKHSLDNHGILNKSLKTSTPIRGVIVFPFFGTAEIETVLPALVAANCKADWRSSISDLIRDSSGVSEKMTPSAIPMHLCAGLEFEQTKRKVPQSLKDWLQTRLSPSELELVKTSYDTLGDCVIVDIPEQLRHQSHVIAQGIAETHKNVRIVCCSEGAHEGVYRVQPLTVLYGPTTRPIRVCYKEHACSFVIHIDRVFFSPRLATERGRICNLISSGESVGVLFAGVGPFAVIFAAKSQAHHVTAIELNPDAVENMRENVRINEVSDRVTVIQGDVAVESRQFRHQFDRYWVIPKRTKFQIILHSTKSWGSRLRLRSCSSSKGENVVELKLIICEFLGCQTIQK